MESFANQIKQKVEQIKPHQDRNDIKGSIISYTMVPISTIISQVDRALYSIGDDLLNKIKYNKETFQKCHMVMNQIKVIDIKLG